MLWNAFRITEMAINRSLMAYPYRRRAVLSFDVVIFSMNKLFSNSRVFGDVRPHGAHVTVQWRHNERDSVSNHRRLDYLFNRLFMGRSKKISKFRVTGLCERNPPVTGGFPSQGVSNAENVSIWLSHDSHCNESAAMFFRQILMLLAIYKYIKSA